MSDSPSDAVSESSSEVEKEEKAPASESAIEPCDFEEFLQTAACLDEDTIDEKVLMCVLSIPSVSELIDEAVDRQFLVAAGDDNSMYRFCSTEMREKAYQSIPREKLEELHVTIAQRLWKGGYNEALVLNQFLQGESFLLQGGAVDYTRLATLCLSAGRTAVRASGFSTAATYFNFGVRLLQAMRACWRDEYDLSLALHCASAEANYCDSNLDKAQQSVEAVIENARCFRDTLGIYATKIYVLGAKGQRQEAINAGLDVLRQLDEPVKGKPKKAHIFWEFARVRYMLRRKTNESILRLPMMENEEKKAAMQILNLIYSHAISVRPILVPLVVFRLVRLTLKYGLTVMSSVGFAMYGMTLCAMGYYDLGYRYSQLALALYDRFPVQEWLPRVYIGVYVGVYSCVKDLEKTLAPLKYSYQVGLETGDIEVALIGAMVYAVNLIFLGRPLPDIEKELIRFLEEATSRKQLWIKNRLAMLLQFVRNFMGKGGSNDPKILTGDVFDADTYRTMEKTDPLYRYVFHMLQMELCYIFGDYKRATQDSRICQSLHHNLPTRHVVNSTLHLFNGLSAVARLKETNHMRAKRIRITRHSIKLLKEHALQTPGSCSGKLFLLRAELAWLLGKYKDANFNYVCAVEMSTSAGSLLDQALANERAGCYKLDRGEKGEASSHFQEAQAAYSRWGAHAKAEQLAKEMAKVL